MSLKQILSFSAAAMALIAYGQQPARANDSHGKIKHVLLISVDGLHGVDVTNYLTLHPKSAFARLLQHGISYTNVSTSRPSDSSPGLVALVTGGSPRTTGVYYDDSYDRTFSPPGDLACSATGTETMYAENIDNSFDTVLGGSTPAGRRRRDKRESAAARPGQWLQASLPASVSAHKYDLQHRP
jgi:hypothetical protein